MVIAMLLCLIVVSVSGLKIYAIEEGLGPLAGVPPVLTVISPAYADDDEHLVKAMLTGNKISKTDA